ncbi:hypothetical protein HN014_04055 [Aquimarina sp. TRL1]|uniref:hypothetical protein n=1 Tax=Aquimarina sp. (strain TRL1) TaxID=2736252 RepID=UPI00158BB17F|nr:hypothetical protein [Aquimarina sp. TRL1]QKX04113.1 hypothetical protein HN014_04055 [Aquimarina sp. TRL1]
MTTSFNIECEDCQKKYRIRYGLGNNFPQLASFQCYDCSKQIETGYTSRGEDRVLKGAYVTSEEDPFNPEIEIVNLHPEIPTRKGKENDPYHFQTFDVFDNLNKSKANFDEFKEEQIVWSKFNRKWEELKMPLRILSFKGEDKMKSISKINYRDFTKLFNEWMMIFIRGKLSSDYDDICDEYNSINSQKIKEYVKSNDKFLKQINEFCNVYMKHHHHFQSTIFHLKYGWEITDEMIANINWDEIHKVYGDLYEIIGDLFVIPTMINNLANGREFDEFQTDGFTLTKYLKTDKSGRANNFDTNSNLSHLSSAYESGLRNGTHHKNSYLDTETFEVSLGTSKGGTIEKKIPIIEYISKCNQLFGMGIILSSLILEMNK